MRKRVLANSYITGLFTGKKIGDYIKALFDEIKEDRKTLKFKKDELLNIRVAIKEYTKHDIIIDFVKFLEKKINYKDGYYKNVIKTKVEEFVDAFSFYREKMKTLKALVKLYNNYETPQYNVIFHEFCFNYFNELIDSKKRMNFPGIGVFQIKKVNCSNIRYIDKLATKRNLIEELKKREAKGDKELIHPSKFVVFQEHTPYRLYLKWNKTHDNFYRAIGLMSFKPTEKVINHLRTISYELDKSILEEYEDVKPKSKTK